MNLIQLDIRGISYSQTQTGAYALVLNELHGERTLPIVIGAFEAQSIAIALENEIKPPRPLTHDLFKKFAESYQIKVTKVIIHKLVDGVFYSTMYCKQGDEEKSFDARTSDSIALAIRYNAPIYTHNDIMDKVGIILKNEDFEEEDQQLMDDTEKEIHEMIESVNNDQDLTSKNKYANLSTEDLEKKLKNAISQENYEVAAQIRDELNKR